jgi:hypothetical protein
MQANSTMELNHVSPRNGSINDHYLGPNLSSLPETMGICSAAWRGGAEAGPLPMPIPLPVPLPLPMPLPIPMPMPMPMPIPMPMPMPIPIPIPARRAA